MPDIIGVLASGVSAIKAASGAATSATASPWRIFSNVSGMDGTATRTGDAYENFTDYAKAYTIHSLVHRCVNLIAQNLASVPLQAYRREASEDGSEEYARVRVPLFDDLLGRPNEMQTGFEFLLGTVCYLMLDGNSYWRIITFGNGYPAYLYPMRSDLMSIKPRKAEKINPGESPIEKYIYKLNGEEYAYMPDEIVHIRLWNPYSPLVGIGPISAARLGLELDFLALTSNKRQMVNYDRPGGVLETEKNLTDANVRELRRQWTLANSGRNTDRTAVLHSGLTWKDTSVHPKDMAYLATRKNAGQDICAAFGVPASMVGLWESPNYATAKEQERWFWEKTLLPLAKHIQSVLTWQFVKPFYGDDLILEFDTSSIDALNEGVGVKADNLGKLVTAGIPLNDALKEVDLAPEGAPYAWGDEPKQAANPFDVWSVQDEETEQEPPVKSVRKSQRTPEQLSAHWKAYASRHATHENRVKRAVGLALEDVADSIVARIAEVAGGREKIDAMPSIGSLFDKMAAEDALSNRMREMLVAVYSTEANRTDGDMARAKGVSVKGPSYGWDRLGPRAQKYLKKLGVKISTMADTMKDDVERLLVSYTPEMLAEGVGLRELGSRIREIIGDSEHYRADRIARTETGSVMNAAHMDVFADNGVKTKIWVSMMDADVRDTHAALNGTELPLDEQFVTTAGNRLMQPNDPDGDASEVISCRCTILAGDMD